MKIGAAKLIQADTKEQDLEYFVGLNVQLTFRPRRFEEVDHRKIKSWLESYNVNPISIHYPSFRGIDEKFIDNLKLLRDTYEQTLFTVHPKFETLGDAVVEINKRQKEVAELGITLAYENMPGPKGNWSCYPKNVAWIDFSFTALTFDVTHLPKDLDETEEMRSLMNKIPIVHLSNVIYEEGKRRDHLPIEQGDRDLIRFVRELKIHNYTGQIILEYTPRTANLLKRDIEKLYDI